MKRIKIAIDGPAGSGKSTTAKIVAEHLDYLYIDTGAMYRAVTLEWLRTGQKLTEPIICNLIKDLKITIINTATGQRTLSDGKDVSEDIRLPEVTKHVSPVSAIGCVREKLVFLQRELGKSGGVVMDGRDIGTVVFPDAELKIFLVASPEARAERRTKELKEKGFDFNVEEIKRQMIERDHFDSHREISPLRRSDDAIEIDTSNLTIEEQSNKIIVLAKQLTGE